MAAERLRSSAVQVCEKISHVNTTTEMPSKAQPSVSEISAAVNVMTPVALNTPSTAKTARPPPTAQMALRRCRASPAALPVDAGCSPASPRYLLPSTY